MDDVSGDERRVGRCRVWFANWDSSKVTVEDGCERRKLDRPTANPLDACTREDVGKMLSDCPERTTHNILDGPKVAVG